jgi:insertion element IS1 protein InsB
VNPYVGVREIAVEVRHLFDSPRDVQAENLKAFNVRTYYTDGWGSYSKLIPKGKHVIGKQNTQKIENKNLLLRTRIKRLARKTICFSKSEALHDAVIGLFINRYCFETT